MPEIRHFLNLSDLSPDTLKGILARAHELKSQKFNPPQLFSGLTLAMMFDKRSTRTRLSFEVAMKQLGGHTVVMNHQESQIGGAESIESTAKVMSRFVDGIMARMSDHAALTELSSHTSIPVINGMTDLSHPCQIMASLMTIEEKLGSIEGKKLAWFGDSNNVSNTYVEAADIFGYELVLSGPEDIFASMSSRVKDEKSEVEGSDQIPLRAALGRNDNVRYDPDPKAAAKNADVLITDTWVSMGQEGKGIDKFWPYQVNSELMALANEGAIFTHCLPMHEWEEVSEEVAKSEASVIFDEAENRLHAQKAILAWCLENAGVKVG